MSSIYINCDDFVGKQGLVTAVATNSICHTVPSTAASLQKPNIMLLGQQPVLSNIVMNTAIGDDSASQIGRKIMPKPQIVAHLTQPIVNPISLTPVALPLPPTLTSGQLIAPVDTPPPDQVKKKRVRKKKAKQDADASSDILAEAAASLFSVKKDEPDNTSKKWVWQVSARFNWHLGQKFCFF